MAAKRKHTTAPRSVCSHSSQAMPTIPSATGKQVGMDYRAGEGVGLVEAHVSDDTFSSYPWVDVFINGQDSIRLEEIEAMLPNLIALVNDPRVQAAKAAKAAYRATLQPQEIEAAQSRKVRLVTTWLAGFAHGTKAVRAALFDGSMAMADRVQGVPADDADVTPKVSYGLGFADSQLFAEERWRKETEGVLEATATLGEREARA